MVETVPSINSNDTVASLEKRSKTLVFWNPGAAKTAEPPPLIDGPA
jgi:hypothetical protein